MTKQNACFCIVWEICNLIGDVERGISRSRCMDITGPVVCVSYSNPVGMTAFIFFRHLCIVRAKMTNIFLIGHKRMADSETF